MLESKLITVPSVCFPGWSSEWTDLPLHKVNGKLSQVHMFLTFLSS